MTSIIAKNLSISFSIRHAQYFSAKVNLLRTIVGGNLNHNDSGVYVSAVAGANFYFKSGDRVGLYGHNGAGKSTLLRAIAGIYSPISGSLDVTGKITSLLDISMGMDHEATGIENILMRGIMMGVSVKKMKNLIGEISDFSELGDYMHMPVRTYSSGMQLRLAFSISTSIPPEILLLDEWLSVGDSHFLKKSEKRMLDITQKTKIMIIASHSHELISKICNRFFSISHGNIQEVSVKEFEMLSEARRASR
jgi:lipopolysaccharide transport system ATP-binding protein